ncbi:MAG TPA: ethanolamine utilization protein EutH [Ruminococcaceae bacterium]|nr:ethanolamine utilization protein EutH [Oscillospiraceae bacterium]
MDYVGYIMLGFALLGLLDRIAGNRFHLGEEFEKGFELLGTLILTMLGMFVLSPVLARLLEPFFTFVYSTFHIDPSIITSSLFANDMGGALFASSVTKLRSLGLFNGLVVGSMMGATVSFTIPYALSVVGKERQKEFILGLLCGIVTIPFGCIVGSLVSGLPPAVAAINLIPLVIFALILTAGLLFFPEICIKIFKVFGIFIKILISLGLGLALIKHITGYEVVKGLGSFDDAINICLACAIALAGAFPALKIITTVFSKPLSALGEKLGINEKSTNGLVSSLASNVPTLEMINKMDSKGALLNSAFAVSASFIVADHLAFTLAFDKTYLGIVMLSKAVSGVCAIIFACFVYKKVKKTVLNEE